MHGRLLDANPGWLQRVVAVAPDGDAQLDPTEVEAFRVLACPGCDGVLKPDVVFFGGTVPAATVDDAWQLVHAAEVLLVIGSSLEVYSGFRFVRGAATRGMPIAILNQGPTRGDALATWRLDGQAGVVLPALADLLAAAA